MAKPQLDRFLGEDAVQEYTSQVTMSEQFEDIYNLFVESDMVNFKKQMNELKANDFAKFMIHILGEMRVDPREVVRTLQSIVD
jgi:hypothetical protein